MLIKNAKNWIFILFISILLSNVSVFSTEIINKAFSDKAKKNISKLLSNSPWIKIIIDSEGIFKLDRSLISSLGYSITPAEIPTIKIFGNGGEELSEIVSDASKNSLNEQPIYVIIDNNSELDAIYFYASPCFGFKFTGNEFKHYINHYTTLNYYFLTWGGDLGKRAEIPAKEFNSQVENYPTSYTSLKYFEEELNNAFVGGSGRYWFGGTIFPRTFTNVLDNLDRSGVINYRFSVAHRSSQSSGNFTVSESGNDLANIYLSASSGKYVDAFRQETNASLPASYISSDNRSILKFSYNNQQISSATPFFDWYEIQFPRSFVPINNEITFYNDPKLSGVTEFQINGFKDNIFGFDVTDLSSPKVIKNSSSTGGMFIFRDSLEKNLPHRYFISSNIKIPSIEKTEFANLRTDFANTDVIIITHPDLYSSAEKFMKYRMGNSNLSVSLVRIDEIFNEFGSGIADPTAIRDFLAYTYAHWQKKPKYVILWGDGHYDYKNIQSNTKNYIPPYESPDTVDVYDAVSSYTTDDYYARISGNDKNIDISIGRLPIASPDKGDWIVEKIKQYESSSSQDSWRTNITLLADDSWAGNDSPNGATHTNQSETLSVNYLPKEIQQKKIYLVEYPTENVPGGKRKPRVTEDMVTRVNTSGTLLLNWIGHGNPRVWAHEEIFERGTTIPLMNNADKLFFLTAATCDFGRFDMPDIQSGAEELLMSKIGGAIGVFAATRVVFSGDNSIINNDFYKNLFIRDTITGLYSRLGDVMYKVKQRFNDSNSEKFYLLGDPTMRILIPNYIVKIDSINGSALRSENDTIQLQALSNVRISARIINPVTLTADTTFGGTAIITTLDSDEKIAAIDFDGSIHNILKPGGALNRSSYKVINGSFSANFVIPKDISFTNERGKIYAYAYAPDKRYAKGFSQAFKISGINNNPYVDEKGPAISVYLDARTFTQGDYVNSIPLLIVDMADESGINTTGLGIGHRIEAWIDDSPNSIDLTDKFSTSLENSKAGSIEQILFGILPGQHTIKVRCWDVYNNYSIAYSYFRIAATNEVVIENLSNYPNPFTDNTTFIFKHNITPPFDAEIQISTVNGMLVRTLSQTINTLNEGTIYWNGMDSAGASISTGSYIYRLSLRGNNSISQNKSGILIFVK